MYPSTFEYFAPESLDDAFAVLDRFGEDAKVLAGGQSLIPLMKFRFATPRAIVDLNRLPGLDRIEEADGELRIGALVRHKTCERSPLLARRYRVLAEAAPLISDPIVRNLGTVAGSLAHADPQGDWGAALIAAGASVTARSSSGSRRIDVWELFDGPFTTVLRPDEIVTHVHVPDPGARAGGSYHKLERKVGDFGTAGVAVHVALADGRVERAGIGLSAVGPTNLRARDAEDALRGQALDEAAIANAARLAAQAARPHEDIRGSVEYKRNVVRVFCERGLRAAAQAAQAA